MTWIRLAPIFGILAIGAGLTGLLVPESRNLSVISLVIFGLSMLYGWFLTVRSAEKQMSRYKKQGTELKKTQQELIRHRSALDELADGLDQAIFLLRQNQTILYANRTASSFFGFQEPIGQTLLAVTLSNELQSLVEATIATGEPQQAEVTLRQPLERIVTATIWMESSPQARIFVSLVNITGLRRLERVRRDFVANVSHELRTPMTTIRAMAETIQDEVEPDNEHKPFLGKIIKEVDRLTRITDDLMALSVAESASPPKADCNFAQIVNSVVDQLRPKAESKDLTLTLNSPKELSIFANEEQLTQVALNLIDNAINYTSQGEVTVELLKSKDDTILLNVKDTGIGVASEHIPRLFERFYRVDKGRSRATGGTGLGLSIVRHIVESHGGRIEIESELNKGSTFSVSLPTTIQT